jgi:integrase
MTDQPQQTRRGGRRDGLFQRNGWWWVDYTDAEGRRHRQKAAPSYDIAKLVYRDKMNAIAKGEVLGVREEGLLLRDYVDKHYWPAVKAKLAPAWATRSRGILDALITTFGNRRLSGLRQDEVEGWYAKRLEAVSATTANKELARLKHLFGRAIEWRFVKTSPVAKVGKAKEPDGRVRYLTADERQALLDGANDRLKLYIEVALQTGARRAELMRLRWADVDMKTRIVTFRKTKNGRDRSVPMTDALYATLQALPRPLNASAPVLPVYDDPHVLTRSFARLIERVGLKDLSFHDLRHDVASTLTMSGVSQRAVMEILGHRDPRMTIRYQHLEPGHLRAAMQALKREAGQGLETAPSAVGR